jgi:hypothetical protein
MSSYYTKQYRAFARKMKLSVSDLAPFWGRARHCADSKFGKDSTDEKYWPYVWATFTSLVTALPAR